MADYSVDIQAKLSGFEKLTEIEAKINNLNNKTIKINFDDKNIKKFNINNIGKQIQNATNHSVNSSKFDSDTFYKQYYEQAKKDLENGKKVDKDFEKNIKELKDSTVSKEAQKAVKAHNIARQKAEREYFKEQKRLANIRQKESDSYYNPYKEAYQSIGKKSDIQKNLSSYYKELEIQSAKEAEMYSKIISNAQNKVLNGAFDAKSSIMKNKLSGYDGQNSDLINAARKEADAYNTTLNKLKDHFDSSKSFKLSDKEIVSSFNNMTLAAEKFDNAMTQIRNTESKSLGIGVAERSANAVRKYYEDNSKAVKKYGIELKDLENRYRQAATVADKAKLDNEFKNLKASISSQGLNGKSFFAEMNRGFKQIGQFALTYGAIQRVPYILKQMASEVLSVDTAMTNLYKVTDETTAKYNDFLNNAGSISKSIGRDMSSYITQTSEWAKLGYSMDQSANLSKISSIYSNVGEVDDKTAVSDLVTVMKAYDINYNKALSIVDKYNKLGNEFATSAKDLGEGMSNAASMLSLGGTDLNKALALLTGGAEITQSAGELGNALKIGQMRIQGMKGDLEALGEESDGLESVSKIQTHILNLTKGQVNIMDSADSTKFRDYYDILEDVSKVYDDLEQTDRADLLETMFGKNRGNQGAAILQAFKSGQIQKAYEATLNAEGSAQQEQDRWMQSMEAKIQQFRSQFQELSNTAFNSDFLKGAIDSGTNLLNVLTQIIDVGGAIPTLLTAIGGIKLFKNLDLFYKLV